MSDSAAYNVDFTEAIATGAGAQAASMFMANRGGFGGGGDLNMPVMIGAGATAGCMMSGVMSANRNPSWFDCTTAGVATGATMYFLGPQLSGIVGQEYLPLAVGGVGSVVSQLSSKKLKAWYDSWKAGNNNNNGS